MTVQSALSTEGAHYRDVPDYVWRWPSFSPAEIASRDAGAIRINAQAIDKLQSLRNRFGKPLIVRSVYRSPAHNRATGGTSFYIGEDTCNPTPDAACGQPPSR